MEGIGDGIGDKEIIESVLMRHGFFPGDGDYKFKAGKKFEIAIREQEISQEDFESLLAEFRDFFGDKVEITRGEGDVVIFLVKNEGDRQWVSCP